MDKTIADLFCDTYVVSDPNGKCCYILIPGLENNSRLMNDKSLIFGSGSNPKKLTTFEGKPAYQNHFAWFISNAYHVGVVNWVKIDT